MIMGRKLKPINIANRPKRIIYEGFTRWTNTWLGRFSCPYDPQEAAGGKYSSQYKHWKNIVFPFIAVAHKVGGERVKVRIIIL